MSTKRKIIGVDFDDVLISFNDGFFKYNSEHYDLHMKREDHFDFDYSKTMQCEPDEIMRRLFEFYNSEDHKACDAIRGAQEALNELHKKHDIHIVTSRAGKLRPSVEEWVHRMYPGMITSIHFTDQFHGEDGKKTTKVDICDELGIEIFVEDALHHAEPIAVSGRKVYLLNVPWNQNDGGKLHPNITRVHSWDEIVKDIA